MYTISLIGTLVLAGLSSSIMRWLGGSFGRRGYASLFNSLCVGLMWSVPLCWIFWAESGGGHGPNAFPIPAWLIVVAGANQISNTLNPAIGATLVSAAPLSGNLLLVVVLALGLVTPIVVFVFSARSALAERSTHSTHSTEVDPYRGIKRFIAVLIVFAAHLALTYTVFATAANLHWAFMDSIPSGRAIGPWPENLQLALQAERWVGFPLIWFGGTLANDTFSLTAVESPVFWFFAISNSILFSVVSLKALYYVNARMHLFRHGPGA